MTTITVSMQWEIEEGFNYHVTASEEVAAAEVAETQQYLHDLCREHRQVVQAAVTAYYQRALHQNTADYSAGAAADSLAQAEAHKLAERERPAERGYKSAARSQAIADEAKAKADAIEIDEDWLPW